MPVCDTEFLFALRATDRRHPATRRLLETNPTPSLRVPVAALWELIAVYMSRGIPPDRVSTILSTLAPILEAHRIPLLEPTLSQFAQGMGLMDRYSLTLFDALVAGAALEHDRQIVGNDTTFDRVPGLKRIPLEGRT